MRRRVVLQSGLAAFGGWIASPLDCFATTTGWSARQPSALLARQQGVGADARWRCLSERARVSCQRVARTVRIDHIAFSDELSGATIDARFATDAAVCPFRIASLQRDSLSPVSKPFAFCADSDALLGFEVLQRRPSEPQPIRLTIDLIDHRHQSLAAGSYLLAVAPDRDAADLSRIVRTFTAENEHFAASVPRSITVMKFTVLSPSIG